MAYQFNKFKTFIAFYCLAALSACDLVEGLYTDTGMAPRPAAPATAVRSTAPAQQTAQTTFLAPTERGGRGDRGY